MDVTRDPIEALDVVIDFGVQRVLTSGGASTALEGADTIATLVKRAADSLTVIAGGNVRVENVAEIVRRTGVREVHAWVAKSEESGVAQTEAVAALVSRFKRT
jgi:copper homeostasis protein